MRKWIIIGVLAIFAICLGLRFGKPLYLRLMAERMLHAAQAKAAAHDTTEAIRLYVLALQKDNANIAVLNSFAAFLTQIHDPQAIPVRARISQLKPDDDDAFLEYVETTLAYGGAPMAHGLLLQRARRPGSKIGESARFVHLLGTCFFLENNLPLAEAAYSEAARRDPKNRSYLINKAQLLLYASDPAIRDAAIVTLDLASGNAGERQMVLPSLLQYASQAPIEPPQLEDWLQKAEHSLAPTDDGFPAFLTALKRWRPDRLAAGLDGYAKASAARSESALAMQLWFLKQGMDKEMLEFRGTLPKADQTSPQSLRLAAEAMFRLKQTDLLSEFLENPAWKSIKAECLAWKERLRRAPTAGNTELRGEQADTLGWQGVLGQARDDPEELFNLARLTKEWGWIEENETTLWEAANRGNLFSCDALNTLALAYMEREDGNGYLRVLERQYQITPDDPIVTNNLAFMSFLFRRGDARAARMSDELCRRYPHSADIIATNAFGHFMKGDIEGALKLFETTSPGTLMGTSAGMTYGLILAANGNHDAARFLKDAGRWTHFPQERQLINEARKKIEP